MTQAFSYVRFSTKTQASGTSLQRQIEASKLFCAQNSLELSTTSYHDLGISGFKNVKRPELEQMLDAVRSGDIPSGSYILIEAIDRLSRKGISHTQDVLKSILSEGVKVAFVGEDAKTLAGQTLNKDSLNDLSSVILVALAADLAHKESLRKSKLVRAAKAIKREQAASGKKMRGRTASWLSWSEEKQQHVFNEHLYKIKKIIELKLKGHGPRKIAEKLNVEGVPSVRGNQWSHVAVRDWLKNPALYGAYQAYITIEGKLVPDILVKDQFPAVIDYETFLQIQSDNKALSKGRTSIVNPFSGLLRCECGSALSFTRKTATRNGKTWTYDYFYCINSAEGRCEHKKMIKDLGPLLLQIMDKLEIKEQNTKNLHREEIQQKEQKIQQLNDMLLEMDIPPVSVLKTIANLEKELKELLDNNDQPNIASDAVKHLSSVDDPEEYNMYLKRIVQQITIFRAESSMRIKVQKRDSHSQNFLVKSGEVVFSSDTARLKKLLQSMKED